MGWGSIYKRRMKVGTLALLIYLDYKALQQRDKWISKSKSAALWENAHERNAKRVLRLIVQLEGLWVKLGQYLSTRADVLPEAYTSLLKQLQDSLPPRPLEEVSRTMQAELGKSMDELFLDFVQVPLATASIAQVHRATLLDGQEVVVKVQHEGIKTIILEDLKNAKSIVDWIAWAEPQYNFNPMIDEWCKECPMKGGYKADLHVQSLGHALHAFVNGKLAGSGTGNSGNAKVSVEIPVEFASGKNTIDLLSLTVGLQNYGAFFDLVGAGITGPVQLKGSANGTTIDLSSQHWTYQIGLIGEDEDLPSGSSQWISQPTLPKNQPMTWYKTQFDAPGGSNPVAIDFTGMGKGEAWVNGQSIGRYWPTNVAPKTGCTDCNYRGAYSADKCRKNCGMPSQKLYHVPRSWMKSSGNTLVLFEEVGGDPTQLSFATRQVESLCSHVSESHPSPVDMWSSDSKAESKSRPRVSLECPFPNQVISSIKFASYGRPSGTCGSFSHGSCRSSRALSIVQKACVGSKSCSIEVSTNTFGDPCKGLAKSLAVEASCK